MIMRTTYTLLCAAFLLSTAYPLDAVAQPKESVTAQVGRLFDQAEAAFAKGDKQGAYEAFKAAWSLQKSYDIAGNLGVVELKLGKYRDAAEHLAFSLDNFPPTGEEAKQKATEKKLAEALTEVGRLHVRVIADDGSATGASVTLNGRPIGTVPIAGTLFVEPGATTIAATLAGYNDARNEITVAKGSEQQVTLTLRRRGANVGIVVGGAVVTGVGAVTGVVLAVLAGGKGSDANASLAKLMGSGGSNPCQTSVSTCATIHSDLVAHDAFARGTVGAFAAAGAIGIATLSYALLAPRSSKVTGAKVMPTMGNNGAGVAVVGAW